MHELIKAIMSDWLHVALASIVGILALAFLWFVLGRGIRLVLMLRKILRRVQAVDRTTPAGMKSRLRAAFNANPLAPLWAEYEDTLHEQMEERGVEDEVLAVRATVPAESFFNAELVVDGRLHIEFFKHLPGILTGLGIIATFSGLITGLQAFDVTAVDPDALKKSLGDLFGYVGSAFILSAVAIGLAMLFTIVEKIIYAANLHKVASIAAELDGMFRAGVGEEYLSKLVKSSEEGTTQTKQLKESLVEDLKALLTNLTEQQILATRQLSADFGTNLEASLQVPLQKIADTVSMASRDQSDSAGRMIENLMTAFMSKMQDTMGGQMGELSGMMRQSAEAVTRVEQSLRALVDDMQQASRSSSEGIQSAMQDLLASLSAHEKQQSESIGSAQVQLLAQLQASTEKMASAQEEMSRQVAEAATSASSRIAASTAEAQKASEQSAARAHDVAHAVQTASMDAISQLETGAQKIATMLVALDGAAERLGRSGDSVSALHERAAKLGQQVDAAASALRLSAETLQGSSQTLSQASIRVEGVAGLMASEAGARESAMREVQIAMSRSQEASAQFAQLSEQVTAKMEDAVERFGNSTTSVLEKTLTAFDKELKSAVDMLGAVLERMTEYAADREE